MGARGTEQELVVVPVRQAVWAGGIDSVESISGLLKSLKIPSQANIVTIVIFVTLQDFYCSKKYL
jgi:hypothetical protein